MKFIVNGKTIPVETDPANAYAVSYEQVCEWAGYDPTRVLTVVWSTKAGQGTLTAGKICMLLEGMIFNVADTSNA